MIALDILHEGAIQHNVEVRYGKRQIYTYVGTILVSINPYETIPNLYTEETIKEYLRKGPKAPPHLYAVSDKVFAQMSSTGRDQALLIRYGSRIFFKKKSKTLYSNFKTLAAVKAEQGRQRPRSTVCDI